MTQNKELHFHLFEFAGAKGEIPWRDFIAVAFANLGDAEGEAMPGGVHHVLEVDENALSRFRPPSSAPIRRPRRKT